MLRVPEVEDFAARETRPAPRGPLRALSEVLAKEPGAPLVLGDAVSVEEIRKSPELQLELMQAFQENRPGAAEVLVQVHIPLIKSRAGRYYRSCERDMDDLIQEGILGMLEACARWDFSRGTKQPINYIYPYVRQSVGRFASQRAQVVRYPVQHSRAKGPEADRDFAPKCWFFSELDARSYFPRGPRTRHAIVAEDEDVMLSFEDGIVDDAPSAEEVLCDRGFEDIVPAVAENLTRGLTPQKRNIIARRFREDEPETLLEIGESYGLSRERIRQLENAALGKCRDRAAVFGCDLPEEDGVRPPGSFEEWVMALSMRLRMLAGGVAELVLAAKRGRENEESSARLIPPLERPAAYRELSATIRRVHACTAHLWRGFGTTP